MKAPPLVHASLSVDQTPDKSQQTKRTSAQLERGLNGETPSKSPLCVGNRRFLCKQEVAGSIPAGSTSSSCKFAVLSTSVSGRADRGKKQLDRWDLRCAQSRGK
jgi:hypothetical protein